MSTELRSRRIAVIGGGITGLAAAHRLGELDAALQVTLLEAGEKPGGVLQTEHADGFLLERSADNFITNVPWGVELCRRLGLEGELLRTSDRHRRAFVVRAGKLVPVPEGFMLMRPQRLWPVVTTPLLSPWGKLRLLWEYFVPADAPDAQHDESLAAFARRRLGREAFERLVQPLVAGIYTADAEHLSVPAALPRFAEMERRHGSLIRAAWREGAPAAAAEGDSAARYSMFVAPRKGMTQLVEALAAQLPAGCLRTGAAVERLQRDPQSGWLVTSRGRDGPERFEAVIVALPAPAAAALLEPSDALLAGALRGIPYAGSAVVTVGYRRGQLDHPLDGFGFVVPAIEGRQILAGSFSSVKFAGRAPKGHVLIRVFLGGSSHPQLVEADDDRLAQIVDRELGELLGVRGEPVLRRIVRWEAKMPQYHLGHLRRVEEIRKRLVLHAGLELAGNAYEGVGIPHCVRSGEEAAERLSRGL